MTSWLSSTVTFKLAAREPGDASVIRSRLGVAIVTQYTLDM